MKKNVNKFVSETGDFEFPNFLYDTINNLMKSTLDLGTLACADDKNRLRAFKETVKKNFKSKWSEIAEVLEEFDLIEPCTCVENEFCTICGGSRFVTNQFYQSDAIVEVTIGAGHEDVAERLREGMKRALVEAKQAGVL